MVSMAPCLSPYVSETRLGRSLYSATPFLSSVQVRSTGYRSAGCTSWRSSTCLAASIDAASSGTDPRDGVECYRPLSFDVLLDDAVRATTFALGDGYNRLEVEFPPLSGVSSYKGSSDDFIDANIQFALAFAKKINTSGGITSKIVLPDGPEKRRASRVFRSAFDFSGGVSLGCLDDVLGGKARGFLGAIRSAFELDFGEDISGKWESSTPPSLYIVVNCSTNELPAVQNYVDTVAASATVVLFNLELDTLRSDLGLFGFPAKDLHYEFLSQFLPAFYIRTRDYSKNVPFAPYVVNYSGALFRQYPGPWQVMVKQTNGSYACIAEARRRFTLGETKEELLAALGLREQQGSTMDFLRKGYKTSTWWEDDDAGLEKSSAWRS